MATEKVRIITEAGEHVEAQAPYIISASRSTDIPAFYAPWFFNRLQKGYCKWVNPFNRQPIYISFRNCKAIVFWTKNPKPILPYLPELDRRGIHYYFQVTLNDYEPEGFEPNVPVLTNRISTFQELSNLIGPEKVIWRFDPLIVTQNLKVQDLLSRIHRIGDQLIGYTHKLVFSFVDIKAYNKVQANLVRAIPGFSKENVCEAEMTQDQRLALVHGLVKMRDDWNASGADIALATCAEDIPLEQFGIEHNRCIDGNLMNRLFAYDEDFVYYLNTLKWPVRGGLFNELPPLPVKPRPVKDPGQRRLCGCMVSKDIGSYNTCPHLCAYCYANSSRDTVLRNFRSHSHSSESILP